MEVALATKLCVFCVGVSAAAQEDRKAENQLAASEGHKRQAAVSFVGCQLSASAKSSRSVQDCHEPHMVPFLG